MIGSSVKLLVLVIAVAQSSPFSGEDEGVEPNRRKSWDRVIHDLESKLLPPRREKSSEEEPWDVDQDDLRSKEYSKGITSGHKHQNFGIPDEVKLSQADIEAFMDRISENDQLPNVKKIVFGTKKRKGSKESWVVGYLSTNEKKNLCKVWLQTYFDEDDNPIHSKTKFGCL